MTGLLNYTLTDLIGALWSTLLFVPLLIPLGYVLGWFTGVFSFRSSSPPWRLLIGLVLSIVTCPVLLFWIVWLGRWQAAWVILGVLSLTMCLLLAGRWGHERLGAWLASFRNIGSAPVLIASGWLLITIFSLVDLQLGNRLYFNVSSFDHSLRTEFTHSITRTGVPPLNPLFHLGSVAPLKYHYFWFILCSAVEQMGSTLLNARHAMIGSIVWAGWGIAALIPLFFRYFYRHTGSALRTRSTVGVMLLAVTGLDIIPNIFYFFHWHYLYPDMEWWNSPICAWASSLLWVPHQIVSLIACLFGLLLSWEAGGDGGRRVTVRNGILAGFAFATAVGTSVFVTLVFTIFFVAWMSVALLTRRRSYIPVLVIAGFVATVLLAPHLLHLAAKSGGGALLKVQLRHFDPLERWFSYHHVSKIVRQVLRLVALPLNYSLELGFFALAGVVYLLRLRRRKPWSAEDIAAVTLLGVSGGICTVLSSALVNNDLGVRGFMPAQFVLLLWGADLLAKWRTERATADTPTVRPSWLRPAAAALLTIGTLSSVYALLLFRFYGVATDHGWSPSEFFPSGETGRRTFAFRETYEKLRTILPPSAVVQTNPAGKFNDFPFGLYALRQTAAMNDTCGAEFGGDPQLCTAMYPAIEDIFADKHHPTLSDVQNLCARFSIDALVLRNTDAAWHDSGSWASKLKPALEDTYVRVYLFPHGT